MKQFLGGTDRLFSDDGKGRLDYVTEEDSFASRIEESDEVNKFFELIGENFAELIVACRRLRPRAVEILLYRIKGMTYQQISEICGVTVGGAHQSFLTTVRNFGGIFNTIPDPSDKEVESIRELIKCGNHLSYRRCAACRTEKPLSKFAVRRASPDGRTQTCRECKARQYQNRKLGIPNPKYQKVNFS